MDWDVVGGEKQPSIGFLGLGIMGTAMARNLVKAGYVIHFFGNSFVVVMLSLHLLRGHRFEYLCHASVKV